MLTRLRIYSIQHLQAAFMSACRLFQRPWATLMTVLVIAITLALPALFWKFVSPLQTFADGWQRNGQITLYLSPALSTEATHEVLLRIRQTYGVGEADLTSPEAGLKALEAQEGMQDIMNALSDNPLPAMITVIPALQIDTPEKLAHLYAQLKVYPEVQQAKFDQQWIERLHAFIGFTFRIVHSVTAFLALGVVLIISNALRFVIHSRLEEIRVLKLIGATDPFITRPFLYTGIWYGVAGAIGAMLLVNLFLFSVQPAIQQAAFVFQIQAPSLGLPLSELLLLMLISAILGWLGARLSVGRQLAVIEPY